MRMTLFVLVAALVAPACTHMQQKMDPQWLSYDQREQANRWSVQWLQEEMRDNAIVRQRAVFPYHFAENAAELNSLGRHNLDVLSDHFVRHPAPLTIRRGTESDALYQSRIDAVRTYLEQQGVYTAAVPMGDFSVGGDGLASERVIEILAVEAERRRGRSGQGQAGAVGAPPPSPQGSY